ncbi:hypothetical protein HK405_000401, partial [Cladochytrium tenue]
MLAGASDNAPNGAGTAPPPRRSRLAVALAFGDDAARMLDARWRHRTVGGGCGGDSLYTPGKPVAYSDRTQGRTATGLAADVVGRLAVVDDEDDDAGAPPAAAAAVTTAAGLVCAAVGLEAVLVDVAARRLVGSVML